MQQQIIRSYSNVVFSFSQKYTIFQSETKLISLEKPKHPPSKKEALQKLAVYCAYQERCLQEVQQKLRPFDLNDADNEWVIEQLIQENFLDELRFARTFCRSKFNYKKWGRNKIKYVLQTKGIDSSFIQKGLQEIDEHAYQDLLSELLEKKQESMKNAEPFHVKKKLYAYAISKGFEAELVRELITQNSQK